MVGDSEVNVKNAEMYTPMASQHATSSIVIREALIPRVDTGHRAT
jgi:hypothetical protein